MLMPRVRTTKPVMKLLYYHRMEPSLCLGKLGFFFAISNIFFVNEARLFFQQITPRVSETELGGPYGLPSPSSLPLPPVESVSPIPLPAHSPISSIASPPLPSILPLSPAASPPKLFAPSPFNTPLRSPPPHLLSPPPKIAPSTPAHKAPPPPHKKPQFAVWCVAKPTVPNLLIQQALDYACGSGADCKSILPNGPCFQPNTLVAHASYAFNSYWQKTKIAGGTCDFGGTGMLVTADPSYDNCYFTLN